MEMMMVYPTAPTTLRVKTPVTSLLCTSFAHTLLAALISTSCSAGVGEDEADGPPRFNGNAPNAGGATNGFQPSGAGSVVGPTVTPGTSGPGETNAATGAPISNAPTDVNASAQNGGAGGASMAGSIDPNAGLAGAGGLGIGGANGTPPVIPPVPQGPGSAEISAYFAELPCGARYTALGDGGWNMCLRLQDGGGACANGSAAFTRVTLEGGAAVGDVAQVAGFQDSSIALVTAAGALHIGRNNSVSGTPLIPSGVINFSGGFHAAVALVERGNGFGVLSWTDAGAPAEVILPDGAQPIQVSANYGLACALSTAGDAYCWNAGGNHSLGLTDAPSKLVLGEPVHMISVGQNSVCGVTFNDTLACQVAFYDGPYLPTEGAAPNFQIRQSTFPAVREVHAGFRQGIVVRSDGSAVYLGENTPGADNPGVPFTGATDVIAASGDRGNACVQTRAGSVYCRVGTSIAQATIAGAPLQAQAASCPL